MAYLPFCFEQLAEHFGLPHLAQQLSAQRHEPGYLGAALRLAQKETRICLATRKRGRECDARETAFAKRKR